MRATSSLSRPSFKLAIRARNWSTDSEPSLLALMLKYIRAAAVELGDVFGASAQVAIGIESERTVEAARQVITVRCEQNSAFDTKRLTLVDNHERSGYGSACGLVRLF